MENLVTLPRVRKFGGRRQGFSAGNWHIRIITTKSIQVKAAIHPEKNREIKVEFVEDYRGHESIKYLHGLYYKI